MNRNEYPSYQPHKEPIKPRGRRTVQFIIKSTEKLLLMDGKMAGLSTTLIAKVAGVGVGTLYQYFPNKEALIGAIIEESGKRCVAVVDHIVNENLTQIQNGELNIEQFVDQFISRYFSHVAKFQNLEKVVSEEIFRLGHRQKVHEMELLVIERIKTLMDQFPDKIRPQNHEQAAFAIVYTVEGLIRYALMVKPEYLKSPEFVHEVKQMILGYLVPHGNGAGV